MFIYKEKEFDLDAIELSYSGIKLLSESLAMYFENKVKPFEETESMIFGKVYHTLILEPETFGQKFFFWPEEPKFERKNDKLGIPAVAEQRELWRQKVLESNKGKIPIKQETFEKAKSMVQMLMKHSLAKSLLTAKDNECEKLIKFETDEKYKTFLDVINPELGYIVDLKTIDSANIDNIERAIKNYMYYIQDFLYSAAAQTEYKKPFKFHFIFQETKEPYDLQIINLNESWHELAMEKLEDVLKKWKEFKVNPDKTYLGRSNKIKTLNCPIYLSKKFKNRKEN